jgi:hypothetical protein
MHEINNERTLLLMWMFDEITAGNILKAAKIRAAYDSMVNRYYMEENYGV